MTLIEVAKQAQSLYEITGDIKDINTLLVPRAAIEAAEKQEPVAWRWKREGGEWQLVHQHPRSPTAQPLYTTPPAAQRQWVGLTDEEIEQEFGFIDELLRDHVYRTEAKLKQKNIG